MRDFSWSPTENTLAYWVAEDKDVPARVTLVEIPSGNEVSQFQKRKILFHCSTKKLRYQFQCYFELTFVSEIKQIVIPLLSGFQSTLEGIKSAIGNDFQARDGRLIPKTFIPVQDFGHFFFKNFKI